jgi:hypothetical protein
MKSHYSRRKGLEMIYLMIKSVLIRKKKIITRRIKRMKRIRKLKMSLTKIWKAKLKKKRKNQVL